MPVIAAPAAWPSALLSRRNGAIAIFAGIAATISLAIVADPHLSKSVGDQVNRSVNGIETVAAMLAERSPGQRPKGALANLKHKRSAVEASAVPLGRHMIPPIAGLAAAPETPLIISPAAEAPPLYNLVSASPPILVVPVTAVTGGGGGGGPPILSEIPSPGGGGGVFAPPPIVTQEVPPPATTTASALPEPGSWAMMLFGFAMIGRALRQQKRSLVQLPTG